MLSKLFKYHRLWIGYVLELGCNIDTAKDIVQEFYIKMQDKDYSYNEDSPNFYGCYVILRNMVFDLKRKEKNIEFLDLDHLPEMEDEEYIEDNKYDKVKAITTWLESNSINYQEDTVDYDSDVLKKLYYKTIYEEVFENGKKITQLSRETGISYYSLYNTVKHIKKQINENRDIPGEDL
jgi:hypothetical protein